jgi:serine/threonine protein kinase
VSDNAKDLVTQMLTGDPTKRSTAKSLLGHQWFLDSPEEVRGAVISPRRRLSHFGPCPSCFVFLSQFQGDLKTAVSGLKGMDADRKAQKGSRGDEGQEEINAVRLRAKSNAQI